VEALKIKNEKVPLIAPEDTMKYLGSKMSPWRTKLGRTP
jgi:hypothetical protein